MNKKPLNSIPVDPIAWRKMATSNNKVYSLEFLLTTGWGAVPIESAAHFDKGDTQRLAEAASSLGEEQFHAIPLELAKGESNCVKYDVSDSDFERVSSDYCHANLLLVGERRRFSIACTSGLCFILAGPISFLQSACGGDVDVAIETFREYVSDGGFPDQERKYHLAIVDLCRQSLFDRN